MWPSRGGPQSDHAGGELPAQRRVHVAVHHRPSPLGEDVDVVAGRVQVPGTHAGGTTAHLGEAQPARSVEPLHVGGRRADPEHLVDPVAHLLELAVALGVVDSVGGDELRRDPPGPHRLQHVRVVVADEVVRRPAVDRQGVVEALVALDELLDRHRGRSFGPEHLQGGVQLGVVVDPAGAGRAGRRTWLDDQRVADGGRERVGLVGRVHRRRRRGRDAGRAQRLLHGRLVPAQPGRTPRGARNPTCLPHLGRGQDVRLDRRLQPVDPDLVLDPADRVVQGPDVGDRADLVVVGASSSSARRRASRRDARRCRSRSPRPHAVRGRTGAGRRGTQARRRSRSWSRAYRRFPALVPPGEPAAR